MPEEIPNSGENLIKAVKEETANKVEEGKKGFSGLMSKYRKGFAPLIVIIVVLVILATAGILLLGKSGQQSSPQIAVSTPTSSPTPTQAVVTDLSQIRTCSAVFTSQNGKYVISKCNYASHGKPENLGNSREGAGVGYFILIESGIEKASYVTDYTVSPDQTKVFYGVVANTNPAPLDFASGSPADLPVNLFILDLSSGSVTALTQNTVASFYTDRIASEIKQGKYGSVVEQLYSQTGKETAWSADSKGVIYDGGYSGTIFYCTTQCSQIITYIGQAKVGPPTPPYYLESKIYYLIAENGDALKGKAILQSFTQ